MNKSKLNLSLLIGICTLLLAACSGKKEAPSHVRYIPADAQFVLTVDARSLISKSLQPQELFSESNLKEMGASEEEAKETSQKAERILNSGIDYANTVYVFGQEDGKIVAALLPLDDADKWNTNVKDPAFWKEVFDEEEAPEIQKKGEITYFVQRKNRDPFIVAWNESVLLAGVIDLSYGEREKTDEYQNRLFSIFELTKEKQLIEQQRSFKEAIAAAEDVVLWVDLNAAAKARDLRDMDENAKQYLKDACFTLGLSFDEGEIRADAAFIPSEKTRQEMQLYYNSKIRKKALQIPYKKPVALLSFAISEAALDKIMENEALKDFDENFTREIGLSADEFIKMWDGQFTLALNNFNSLPELAIILGVRNDDLYKKMMDYTTKKGLFTKKPNAEGEVYVLMGGAAHLYKDKNYLRLATGASETIWEAADEPEGWTLQAKKASSFIGIRADLLAQLAQSRLLSSEASEVAMLAEELVIWSPSYEDGKIKGEVLLTFREKDKNALLILIDAVKAKVKEEERYSDEPVASGKNLPMEEIDEESFEEEAPVF